MSVSLGHGCLDYSVVAYHIRLLNVTEFGMQAAHEMLVSCHESDFPKDACYNMARMLTELLMFYVTHKVPDVSDATLYAPADRSTGAVPQLLEDVLSEQVFPLLKLMMQSGWDPLPLYAQKVLAALLIRCVLQGNLFKVTALCRPQ